MIECQPCPQCGKPVMSYGRYLSGMAGSISKVSKCSHCQVELKRNPSLLTLLSVGSTGLAILLIIVAPKYLPSPMGWAGFFALILLGSAGVFFINFLGWLWVGWQPASAAPTAKAEGSKAESV